MKHESEPEEEITLNSNFTQHMDQQTIESSSTSTKSMQKPEDSSFKHDQEQEEVCTVPIKEHLKNRTKKSTSATADLRLFQQAIGGLTKDKKEIAILKKEESNSEKPDEEIPKKKKTLKNSSKVKKEKSKMEESDEEIPKKKKTKKSSKVRKEKPSLEADEQPKDRKEKKISQVKKEEEHVLDNETENRVKMVSPLLETVGERDAPIFKIKPKKKPPIRKRSPSSEKEEEQKVAVEADVASTSKVC